MLTHRTAVIAAAMATVAGVGASAAHADGDDGDSVAVDRLSFGWVSTAVEDGGSSPAPTPKPQHGTPVVRCTQTKSDSAGGYADDAEFESGAPAGAGPGGWVIRRCSDGRMDTAWVPVVAPAAAVEQLAQRATNRLPLPLPSPKFNPSRPSSAGPSTLVNIPTWFWVDGWKPVRQRTQAGGVWAEVVATPVEVTWDPGDGSPVVRCAGPGTAWSPDAQESACEHTYVRSSAGEPANVYTARVTVTWKVSWRGAGGRAGTLPLMERQMTFPIAVAERQTVVTVGGTT